MAAERPPSSALRAGMIGADVSRAFMAGPPPDRSPNHTPSRESPRPDGRFASRLQPRRRTRSPSPAMCTLENERRGARRNDARRNTSVTDNFPAPETRRRWDARARDSRGVTPSPNPLDRNRTISSMNPEVLTEKTRPRKCNRPSSAPSITIKSHVQQTTKSISCTKQRHVTV